MKVKSFAPIATPKSRILILGTMPSTESIKKTEYYAHSKNHFWDILYRICYRNWDFFRPVQEQESYTNKIELLNKNNIALWDILKYCDRKGNLDKHIRNEIKNDIQGFLKEHNNVSKILFNGLNAHKYFIESNSCFLNLLSRYFRFINLFLTVRPLDFNRNRS